MKSVCLVIGFLGCITCCFSQQKAKQIRRMLDQIAANKVYIDYLEKGYKIAHDGLQTVTDIKNGDFHLHLDYFNSLKTVNPQIKNWAKVADIIALQLQIIKESRQTLQGIRQAGQFTNDEVNYCKSIFDNLLNECLKNIDELMTITTDGKSGMKDDERIRRIDKLFADMQDKYSFTSSFSNEMGILSAQRLSEQVDIKMSKKINSTPNP